MLSNMDCIFCKIVKREMPTSLVYEDEHTIAIKDIHPVAPVHLLVIPKEHVDEFLHLKKDNIFVAIMHTLQHLVRENNLTDKGYRIEVNGGGAQLVHHLHVHLIGPIGHAPKV